jgi:hypothetical protein
MRWVELAVTLAVSTCVGWFASVFGGLAVLLALSALSEVIPWLNDPPVSEAAAWMLALLIFLGCGVVGAGGAWWGMSWLFRAAPVRRGLYHLDPPG